MVLQVNVETVLPQEIYSDKNEEKLQQSVTCEKVIARKKKIKPNQPTKQKKPPKQTTKQNRDVFILGE